MGTWDDDDMQFEVRGEEEEMEDDRESAFFKPTGQKRPPKPGTRKQPTVKSMKPPRGMSARLRQKIASRVATRWIQKQND